MSMAMVWSGRNEVLEVKVFADASAVVEDLRHGATWRMGAVALQEEGPIDVGHVWLRQERSICEEFSGRFRGVREGAGCRFTLLGREGQPLGDIHCEFRLDGAWFECRIVAIDEALPSLVFPTPIVSESLVLPQGVGRWVRRPLSGRYFWTFPAHLNMRWFGGLRGEHGWLAVVDEGYQDAGVLATQLSLSPGWLKSLGTWAGKRTVRYSFVRGGYVELAKTYRAYARAKGLFRSLADKIRSTPAVGHLMGGRAVFFFQGRTLHAERAEDHLVPPSEGRPVAAGLKVQLTNDEVLELAGEMSSASGFRGLVVLCGWIRGGYDESHPDVWPPEPALGSVESLKRVMALPAPRVGALHDNYQDIYRQSPSWPKGVIRLRSGAPMPGGYWAGGQAYILNSRSALEYVERNWEQIRTLEPRALYVDTATGVQFYESYEPGNTLSRAQDEAGKIAQLAFFRKQGVALGSEYGADFGMPFIDFLLVNHSRQPGESVPLWPLVFHDAAVCYTVADAGVAPAEQRRQWLTQMLWGHQLRWYFSGGADWARDRAAFCESGMVDAWHARIGLSEMVSHRFLGDGVEESEFANGLSITVNVSDEECRVGDECIPALGHVIRQRPGSPAGQLT